MRLLGTPPARPPFQRKWKPKLRQIGVGFDSPPNSFWLLSSEGTGRPSRDCRNSKQGSASTPARRTQRGMLIPSARPKGALCLIPQLRNSDKPMQLADFFRPRYRNSAWQVRLAAVEQMHNPSDQSLLTEIALTDNSEHVRNAAVTQLVNAEAVLTIAKQTRSTETVNACVDRHYRH